MGRVKHDGDGLSPNPALRLPAAIASWGLPEGLPRGLSHRLRVTNLYALLVTGLLVAGYAPAFYWLLASSSLALGSLAVAAGCALVPWLHSRGFVRGGRYWLLAISCTSVLVFSLVLGPDAGIHLLFFVIACATLAVLDLDDRAGRVVFVALALAGLVAALLHGRLHEPLLALPRGATLLLEGALTLTVLGLLAAVVLYYLRLSEAASRELEHLHRVAKHELDEALRKSEARYGLASRGTHDGVWELDVPGDRLFCSARWRQILGLPAEEATCDAHAGWLARIHPEDRQDVDAALAAHLEGRSERLYCEHRLRHEDGDYRWVLTRGQAVRDGAGRVTRMAGSMGDITERRGAEQRLRQSEERFRQLVRQAADALLFIEEEGHILDANEQACRDLGYERAELVGSRVADLDPHGAVAAVLDDLDALEAVGHDTLECNFRRKDGTDYPVELRIGIVRVDGARHVLTLARNIEKRRAMEAKLMFADRMVSVGTLAAGVAHEINNPLTYMGMNLEYLRSHEAELTRDLDAKLAARVRQAIQRALDGNERVATIVRDLKTFARGDDQDVQVVDVNHVLESTLNLADSSLRRRAQVRTRLQDVPGVRASEARLGQVFLNLVLNAAQALDGVVGRDPGIWIETRLVDGAVEIAIRDNGDGIAPEHLARIFDPFFTTKPVGVGTGLGLFICQNIVHSFDGEIRVESRPGEGTLVRTCIPPARTSQPGLSPSHIAV